MLNLTIRGHDLSGVHTAEELARKTSDQGVHTLQLALGLSFKGLNSDPSAINAGMGNFMKRTLLQENVHIGILSCYINMIHPDLEVREQLLLKFEHYLQCATSFGSTIVATETGCVFPEIRYTEENFTDKAFETAVTVIRRLVNAGEKYNMVVGIEPGLNHPIYSLERVCQLIEAVDSDYLGIILDPTNLISSDNYQQQVQLVESAFDSFGEKICAVHLKDFIVEKQQIIPVNLGEGMMDYQKIIKLIAQKKPYLFVVLEETKDRAIQRAVKLIEDSYSFG